MKASPQPTKRWFYDAAFRAEGLRLAGESRSTQAAAPALNINVKPLYKWQKEALTPVAAARGAELDPATAAELRQLRATNRRQNLVSKQVVGGQVGVTVPEESISRCLQRAFWAQPPTPYLLVYSDRGGQYCGKVHRKLLHDHQALRSQSHRSDGYDNAQAERLWSRPKTEVLEGRERPVFADLPDAQASDYYKHERLYSSIDRHTPYHAHQQLLQLNTLNCPA